MEDILTAAEVARAVQLTPERIRQLAKSGVIDGRLAGSTWLFPRSVIVVIKGRTDRRGGPRTRGGSENA